MQVTEIPTVPASEKRFLFLYSSIISEEEESVVHLY